jgi:hypothetical protein
MEIVMSESTSEKSEGSLTQAELRTLLAALKRDLDALAANPGNLEVYRLRAEVAELTAEIEKGGTADPEKISSVHGLLNSPSVNLLEFEAAAYFAAFGRMLGLS